jgi:hypothetical protein
MSHASLLRTTPSHDFSLGMGWQAGEVSIKGNP